MKSSVLIQRIAYFFSLCIILLGCTEEQVPISVTSVTLDSTSIMLVEGENHTLTATISPSNAENKKVLWSSSNSSVASVKDGIVTAIKVGTATITAKSDDGGKTATCTVTVESKVIPVTGVSLNKTSCEMTEGDEVTLTATVSPENATNKNVSWSSSNTSVATVDNGKVKALKAGTTTITVKTEDGEKTTICEVTVNQLIRKDLSSSGNANCYVISEPGHYKFTPSKGNSNESVGTIGYAEVLWETFGTDVAPNVGELINSVEFQDEVIYFKVPEQFKEGNAVIAAKDASGNILWSWHIWFTDEPQGQEYYNNAGRMMDRNLGATSTTPGDVGALGLLYQWGRKDPFLSSSSISNSVEAKSTITWPSAVSSDSNNGTIAYAVANPTTFITNKNAPFDWLYTKDNKTDNTRWKSSDGGKAIYDPCPNGWKVSNVVQDRQTIWSIALDNKGWFYSKLANDSNNGMDFSGIFGDSMSIWYPFTGLRFYATGKLIETADRAHTWSDYINDFLVFELVIQSNGYVDPAYGSQKANGYSVRCVQE